MSSYRHLPLWGPMAGAALALAWLLPNAHYPWVAFHKDAYLGFVMAVIGLAVLGRATVQRVPVGLPPLALLLLTMGAMVWVQHGLGRPTFFGEAFVGALYFCGAALAVVSAAAWERLEPGAPARLIFIALVLAAIATMAILLGQWLGLGLSGVWFSGTSGDGRFVGNLNQPNNAATLLLWGLIALFWLHIKARIGAFVWVFASAPLLGALVLTGSRINFLSLSTMLLVGSICAWSKPGFRSYRAPLLALSGLFLGFLLLHTWLGGHGTDANPFERELAGARLMAYKGLSMAVLEKPWFGFGFNQTIHAQIAARDLGYPLPALFTWAHNVFLDVAVWFGLPMLALSVFVIVKLLVQLAKTRLTPDRLALSLAVMVFGAHAMVELPHAYAIFLLPACFMVGALIGASSAVPPLSVRPWTALLGMACLSLALLVTVTDYLKVERSFFDWRFKIQRVGTYHPMSVPDVVALDQFHALIRGFRSADKALTVGELEAFRASVLYFPSPFALQQLTILQTHAGQIDAAHQTIRIAAAVLTAPDFGVMAKQWRLLQQQDEALKQITWAE